MKKLTLLLTIPMFVFSCSGEEKKEEKKGPDFDAMAKEYCECMDKERLKEISSCLEEFKEKYVGIKGSDDQKKEFEEKVKEHCGDK